MPTFIRHPKDFWTGIIFLIFGLAAVIIGQDYQMGTAGRMGPGYFPTILGGLLALIGLAAMVRSFVRPGEAIGRFYLKNLALVSVAVLLFGFLMRDAGLLPAVIAVVMVSAYASPKFTWLSTLLISIGLAVFCVLVFVKLLGLPMPMLGPWLTF